MKNFVMSIWLYNHTKKEIFIGEKLKTFTVFFIILFTLIACSGNSIKLNSNDNKEKVMKLSPTKYNFIKPIYTHENMSKRIEAYLLSKQPTINLKMYYLRGLSYDYISSKWNAFYWCKGKAIPVGCYFNVYATNSKKPNFKYWAGM